MTCTRFLPRVTLAFAFSLWWTGAAARAADNQAAFDANEAGQIVLTIDGAQVAVYVYEDAEISRPYFAHLRAPGAPQVTRNHPPVAGKDRADHPTFHPGLWMSFGDISGNDYWRLAARVEHLGHDAGPGGNSFTVRNRYLDQQDPTKTVCEEVCIYTIMVRPAGYLLLWDSTFSSDREFYFGDQEEMGIGFRVATPIRVESESAGTVPAGNGKMVDSEGRINGDEIWGNAADWCDYSGNLESQHVGITLFCHPKNFRASWFHARDYGLLEANPFGRDAFGKGEKSKVPVQPGEKFRLQYGVFVHASPQDQSPNFAEEYANYLRAVDQ